MNFLRRLFKFNQLMPPSSASVSQEKVVEKLFRARAARKHRSRDSERPRGLYTEFRSESFQRSQLGLEQQTGGVWSKIKGQVYLIRAMDMSAATAIVAVYRAKTLLWLDNHDSDDDFAVFSKSENLRHWLTASQDDLIDLLVSSKLFYLSQPHKPVLINNVDDIPKVPSEFVDWMIHEHPEVQKWWDEEQAKRERLTSLVHPP